MSEVINTHQDYLGVSRIQNLPDAISPQEPATLAQLNSVKEGLSWKTSVRVAAQTNVNLASPGVSIDGINLAIGDRALLMSQTTQAENGIYVWNGAATAMTRALDMNSAAEVEAATTTVEEGSSAGTTYRQTAVNVTLGTTALLWTIFGASTPNATETTPGKAEIATQGETDTGTDDARFVTPFKLANWSGRKLKYTTTVGDGTATSIAVTHNLNTTDLNAVELWETGGSKRRVRCEVQVTNANTVTLLFATAPAAGAYRVVVSG